MSKQRKDVKCSPEELTRRRAYYQRPEVQARYKARNGSEAHKAYMREYRKRPEAKRRLQDHNLSLRGFTVDLKERLIAFQDGKCAICRRPLQLDRPRTIHADHCHETRKPRGILCISCNHAEGAIRRSGLVAQEFASRLAAYLKNPTADQLCAREAHER